MKLLIVLLELARLPARAVCLTRYTMTNVFKKIFPAVLCLFMLPLELIAADQVRIRPDAPAEYEVVAGDTLWDISGRFLEDPWLWPEVWELNPQIENPHLIYPGDIIELEYSPDGPMLTLRRAGSGAGQDSGGLRTVILSPEVRREPLRAVPAIPLDRISSVLSGNIVVPESTLQAAPYVLDNRSGSLFGSDNDEIFAKGDWPEGVQQFDIVRRGREYRDPDSKQVIGVEGTLVGSAAMLETEGENATLYVNDIKEEIRKGDRLVPTAGNRIDSNYFPQAPAFSVEGRIIDIDSGRSLGNQYDTIVINLGSRDRIRSGDLLALQKPDTVIEDDLDKPSIGERLKRAVGFSKQHVETFSGEKYASVLVYRVFDQASFGIILNADEIVRLEDRVVTP